LKEFAVTGSGEAIEVSVVIPAYNEELGVAGQVEDVRQTMTAAGAVFEILVVDDGSTDETGGRAEAAGARVLRMKCNRGYGAALKAGIRAARYPWILITDADGTYPSKFIRDLIRLAPRTDMAIGARVGQHVSIPLVRRPAKWLLRSYASVLARQRIPDLNSGMRLMRKTSIERFWDLLPQGFSFTSTITMAMLARGYSVDYVPIDYLERTGRSKIRPRDFLRFLGLVTRVTWRLNRRRFLFPAGVLILLPALAGLMLQPDSDAARAGVAAGVCLAFAGFGLGARRAAGAGAP
jgi:glycosyltransferase involved in cell wall biosynthesis